MRHLCLIAIALLLVSPARAERDLCDKPVSPQSQLKACTWQIELGKWSGRDLAVIYSNRGNAYNRLKQYRRAIADYDAALKLDPKSDSAYNNRGNAYDQLKQHARAIQDYNAALRINPRNADAYNNRAWAYFEWGKPWRGLPDADLALALAPGTAQFWDTRGHINEAVGRKADAIRDYRKALKLDPSLKASRAGLKRLGAAP